jgi:hypothetical protein
MKTLSKTIKHLTVTGAICFAGLVSQGQILNGSFENGLTSWTTVLGDYTIGGASLPIGTSGVYSADLGGGDHTGAYLSQTIGNFAGGGTYRLSYDSGCNAGTVLSRVCTWGVEIIADGVTISSQTLSQQNVGILTGSYGFVHHDLDFTVGSTVQNITIKFVDLTANGGISIDTALDSVSVTVVPEPGVMTLTGLGLLAVLCRRMTGRSKA